MEVQPDASPRIMDGENEGRQGAKKGRKPHPGVSLRAPRGRVTSHVVRYRDPDTGKVVDRVLPEYADKNKDTRYAYCVGLSKQLRRRREDISAGSRPHREADLELTEAVERYFAQATVRARTLESYEEARDEFLVWCEAQGIRTVRHLNRGQLVKFRERVIKTPDRSGDERSPHTINAVLKRTKVVLNWLIDAEVLRLSRDDCRVALKLVPTDEVTKRDFLRVDQITALLEAAKRHDAITYKRDRKGEAPPRYTPIHDYIRFLLLTGLRPGEALALTWDRVDLAAFQLHVHPTQSKKRKDRIVDLSVCPTVISMLEHMRQGKRPHERVWAVHTKGSVDSTLDRLRADPLCPPFDYQLCRVTTATYLACMPSYGPVNESRQLGHGIVTAETFYVGRVKVDPDVRTLEKCWF